MPWIEDPSLQRWQLAFRNALHMRVATDQLKGPLKQLTCQYALPGEAIARILLGFRAGKHGGDDPLLFRYAHLLVSEDYVGSGDLLLALLSTSSFQQAEQGKQPKATVSGFSSCEERVFSLLTELHLTGTPPITPARFHRTTYALTRWLHVIYEREYNAQLESAGLHAMDTFAYGTYEALASLAITVFGQQSFRAVTRQSWWKERRAAVVREMLDYDMHVLQWMHSQWAGRLQALTKLPPFVALDQDGRPILTEEQILESLAQDGSVSAARCRAGLYVWLSACLCGRPMTDDINMLGYLQTRYLGDNQMLTVQLLHASFDVLTAALLRGDPEHDIVVIRSFVCNKVPLMLATLASFMGPVDTCIETAFLSIIMDPIPPISAGSLEATEMLKRTRSEFLQVCALHGVVSETAISSILQEPPIPLPKTVKYTKEGLLSQCTNNVGRLEALTRELQSMQGNAGALSQCIVDLITGLCVTKDTMSLKSACTILIKHVGDMDIVMQYTQPATLLVPLCMLLKDWVHDQDQSEFTPAYEEFASVLLFTLAVLHRYGLSSEDLRLGGIDVFVFEILGESPSTTSLSELGQEQSQQLAKWLEGLFATDDLGETSGISDDVMRQCPPQAFCKLVPALFEQSVMACRSGHLSLGTLKSGLELLLEPFLLPSLVGGLSWLIGHSWEDHGDMDILLQVLDKLLKPSSSSPETQAMHRAVLAIVAKPLERLLQDVVRKRPEKTVANGMIALLRQYAGSTRTASSKKTDVDEWAGGGGVVKHLRNSVRDLVSWAAKVTPTPAPRYQHQNVVAACQMLGAEKATEALSGGISEAAYLNTATALDVCTNIVCAPSPVSQMLRQQLRLQVSDTQTLLEKSVVEATALVRLHRSVEAQLIVHQLELPFANPPQQSTDQMMQELGLTEPAIGADGQPADTSAQAIQVTDSDLQAALEQPMDVTSGIAEGSSVLEPGNMQVDHTQQDIFRDLNMDISQQPLSMQQLPKQSDAASASGQNPDDDIFAGLDMSGGMGDPGDDFSFA